ncbi:MAG TPA: universal stress protein [Burkholderiales bacterium]|nr:universal stress protein [Burkholderiales bacterium]
MIKRILVAYDGSAPADKAYAFALDLAEKYGADIHVIAVARPPDFGDDVEVNAILDNSIKHYEEVMAQLKSRAASLGLNPHFKVVVGHPAEQIIYRAEEYKTDLIVMGHRGKTLFERLRLGSVSKHVIHYAHCAVTIVR